MTLQQPQMDQVSKQLEWHTLFNLEQCVRSRETSVSLSQLIPYNTNKIFNIFGVDYLVT